MRAHTQFVEWMLLMTAGTFEDKLKWCVFAYFKKAEIVRMYVRVCVHVCLCVGLCMSLYVGSRAITLSVCVCLRKVWLM